MLHLGDITVNAFDMVEMSKAGGHVKAGQCLAGSGDVKASKRYEPLGGHYE